MATIPQEPSKKRKRKRTQKDDAAPAGIEIETAGQDSGGGTLTKSTRIGKKRHRKSQDGLEEPPPPLNSVGSDIPPTAAPTEEKRSNRFIVFIGNLPYSTTKAALEHHFSAVAPTSIRLMTAKDDPSRCKGFAFLEFARYDRMELCLTKFHHSIFDDGSSSGSRKINVELTAGGGGGKSKVRKQKLLAKNEKLNEERQRSAVDRAKDKLERRAQAEDGDNGMHPSRRRRIQ